MQAGIQIEMFHITPFLSEIYILDLDFEMLVVINKKLYDKTSP